MSGVDRPLCHTKVAHRGRRETCGRWGAERNALGYFLRVFVAERRQGLGIGLVAVVVVACLAVLTGCSSGGSAPRTLPPLSTTPAAVTSTAPPTSKAAELAAVKAVVRRYYTLINQLQQSMNADAIAELSTPQCPCRSFVAAIRKTASQGQRYFGHIKIISLSADKDGPDYAEALATYDSSAGGTETRAGRIVYRGRPHHGTIENF